jgi:hypothetical protein
MSLVQRFDLARISPRARKTQQGFLEVPAFFTRAGIFEYKRFDGTVVRELRPESEVFRADSMQTLAHAPVTVDHPSEGGQFVQISPDNSKKFSVGHTGAEVKRCDSLLGGNLIIQDRDTIKQVESGVLQDISAGYRCKVVQQSGHDPKYGRYDAIQTNIQYNHAALLTPGGGRAGESVGVRHDSEDAVQQEGIPEHMLRFDSLEGEPPKPEKRQDSMETITINGLTYEVPKAAAEAYRADCKRIKQENEASQKKFDELEGRFDAQKVELEKVKTDLVEATDETKAQERMDKRIALVERVRSVVGQDAIVPNKTREAHEMVLKHDAKDPEDFSNRSDDYVEARFDAVMANVDHKVPDTKDYSTREELLRSQNTPDDRADSKKRLEEKKQVQRDRWKQPLAASKQSA